MDSKDEEIWKDITDYEGLYQVSNIGRVKSMSNDKNRKEKILNPSKDGKGYLLVNLYKDGVRKKYLVHRLVADAFIPNSENKPEVDHIDTNPLNNNVYNLRWVTRKEQFENKLTREHLSGENNHQYGKFGKEGAAFKGIIQQYSLNGELVGEYEGTCDAKRKTGIANQHISECIKGKRKTAGGYIWKREKR